VQSDFTFLLFQAMAINILVLQGIAEERESAFFMFIFFLCVVYVISMNISKINALKDIKVYGGKAVFVLPLPKSTVVLC